MRYRHFQLYRIARLPAYAMDWDEKVVIYEYGMPPVPEAFDIYG